jgi:hypothetical protein
MAFSNPSGSAHVGIDIRNVLKKHDSMFGDSLQPERNRAPTFTKAPSRPTSRPTDISFEAEVIREDSLRAVHGRRAAQSAAYAAAANAGPASTGPAAPNPWTATSTAQRREQRNPLAGDETKAFSQRAEEAGFAVPGRRTGKGFEELSIVAPVPRGYKMREVPAGRGLSRGSSASLTAGAPSSSDAVDLLGLTGSSMSISLGSSQPPQQQHGGGGSGAGGEGSNGSGGSCGIPASWSAARAEATDAAAHTRRPGADSPRHKGGGGGSVEASPSGRRGGGGAATGMARAREWGPEVEDAYRFQVAGYKDEAEALALGHAPIERWPDGGFVRKLVTKESLMQPAKGHSQLYFSKKRECEDKDLNQVKMYTYG